MTEILSFICFDFYNSIGGILKNNKMTTSHLFDLLKIDENKVPLFFYRRSND